MPYIEKKNHYAIYFLSVLPRKQVLHFVVKKTKKNFTEECIRWTHSIILTGLILCRNNQCLVTWKSARTWRSLYFIYLGVFVGWSFSLWEKEPLSSGVTSTLVFTQTSQLLDIGQASSISNVTVLRKVPLEGPGGWLGEPHNSNSSPHEKTLQPTHKLDDFLETSMFRSKRESNDQMQRLFS